PTGGRLAEDAGGEFDFGEFRHAGKSAASTAKLGVALMIPGLASQNNRSTFHPVASNGREMTQHLLQRSLRYEYELYVEREIEDYKDSISRNALLSIGDDAIG